MGIPASNVVSGLTAGNGLAAADDARSFIKQLHREASSVPMAHRAIGRWSSVSGRLTAVFEMGDPPSRSTSCRPSVVGHYLLSVCTIQDGQPFRISLSQTRTSLDDPFESETGVFESSIGEVGGPAVRQAGKLPGRQL